MQVLTVRNARNVNASRKQMLQLACAADRHDMRDLIRTAVYSGMRFGAIQRVEVSGGSLRLADTKNGDQRSIPAHPRISMRLGYALRRWRRLS
jgi:hypothetical protein